MVDVRNIIVINNNMTINNLLSSINYYLKSCILKNHRNTLSTTNACSTHSISLTRSIEFMSQMRQNTGTRCTKRMAKSNSTTIHVTFGRIKSKDLCDANTELVSNHIHTQQSNIHQITSLTHTLTHTINAHTHIHTYTSLNTQTTYLLTSQVLSSKSLIDLNNIHLSQRQTRCLQCIANRLHWTDS